MAKSYFEFLNKALCISEFSELNVNVLFNEKHRNKYITITHDHPTVAQAIIDVYYGATVYNF